MPGAGPSTEGLDTRQEVAECIRFVENGPFVAIRLFYKVKHRKKGNHSHG